MTKNTCKTSLFEERNCVALLFRSRNYTQDSYTKHKVKNLSNIQIIWLFAFRYSLLVYQFRVVFFCCRAFGFNSWPRNIFWSWNLVKNHYFWKSKIIYKNCPVLTLQFLFQSRSVIYYSEQLPLGHIVVCLVMWFGTNMRDLKLDKGWTTLPCYDTSKGENDKSRSWLTIKKRAIIVLVWKNRADDAADVMACGLIYWE